MLLKKILIVDDSATVRHFLIEALAKAGYELSTAMTGDEAVSKAKAELPDLILMDIIMPGMNGFQATRVLTKDEVTKHIPVLMLTSKDMATDRIWAMRQGATEFINKPVATDELLAKIEAALA